MPMPFNFEVEWLLMRPSPTKVDQFPGQIYISIYTYVCAKWSLLRVERCKLHFPNAFAMSNQKAMYICGIKERPGLANRSYHGHGLGCASVLIWNTCCVRSLGQPLSASGHRDLSSGQNDNQKHSFLGGYGHSQIHTPTQCSYMDSYMAFGMHLLDSGLLFFTFFELSARCVFKRFVAAPLIMLL